MHELERVLDVLLHDVRSPLGVVGGYLRLLREGRLNDPAQADRAIGKAQDALRHMADLCAEAGDWLPNGNHDAPAPVAVGDLAAALVTAANGLAIDRTSVASTGVVRLSLPADRVADAVIALMRVARRDGADAVRVHVDGRSLRISAGGPLGEFDDEAPYDPWQHPGLSIARACLTVRRAGGMCVAGAGAPSRPRVRFAIDG